MGKAMAMMSMGLLKVSWRCERGLVEKIQVRECIDGEVASCCWLLTSGEEHAYNTCGGPTDPMCTDCIKMVDIG